LKLNKQEKGIVIDDLKDRFSRAKAVVFTDYKGMTVAEMSALRRQLKDSSVEFRVVKNTLARIASHDTDVAVAEDIFRDPVGVALGYDDPVTAVKKILEFTKTNEKLTVKGAVVEGKLCEQNEIREIAALPSKDVLLSMLAGTLQAPLSKMARSFAATVNSLGFAVSALKNKKEH
jgi:large subunit ribosomal protein L10